MKDTKHRGHAWCGPHGLCVPQQLHDQLEAQLGPRVQDLDLFAFYTDWDAIRVREQMVIEDLWTFWLDCFRAELRHRNWVTPRIAKPPVVAQPMWRPTAWTGCPHTPACLNTRACYLKRRLDEDRKLKATGSE